MNLKYLGLVITAACLLAIVGCRETPDSPIIVSKNDGRLESIIAGDAAPVLTEKYVAPDDWHDSYETGDVTVNVNAKIYVPDSLKYPVYRVYPDVLTDEKLDNFLTYFIGDEKLYWSDYTGDRTKVEIMEDIIKYQEMLSDLGNPNSALYRELQSEMSDAEIEEYKKEISDTIDRLGKQYAQAPVEKNRYEVQRVLKESEDSRNGDYAYECLMGYTEDFSTFINISASMPPYESIRLQLIADREAEKTAEFGIYNPTPAQIGSDTQLISYGEDIQGAKVTFDEALKAANEAISALSYEYTMLYAFRDDRETDFTGENIETYYQFYYTPRIPESELQMDFFISYNGEFHMPWAMPYIIVSVNANGIEADAETHISDICVRSSVRFDKLLNENVPLLQFDEIKQIAEKYLPLTNYLIEVPADSEQGYEAPIHHYVDIDRIRLGYIKVSEKDNLGAGICIPVWMFYGSQTDEYKDMEHSPYQLDENNMIRYQDQYVIRPFLCINAIDGSIIDLTQGY